MSSDQIVVVGRGALRAILEQQQQQPEQAASGSGGSRVPIPRYGRFGRQPPGSTRRVSADDVGPGGAAAGWDKATKDPTSAIRRAYSTPADGSAEPFVGQSSQRDSPEDDGDGTMRPPACQRRRTGLMRSSDAPSHRVDERERDSPREQRSRSRTRARTEQSVAPTGVGAWRGHADIPETCSDAFSYERLARWAGRRMKMIEDVRQRAVEYIDAARRRHEHTAGMDSVRTQDTRSPIPDQTDKDVGARVGERDYENVMDAVRIAEGYWAEHMDELRGSARERMLALEYGGSGDERYDIQSLLFLVVSMGNQAAMMVNWVLTGHSGCWTTTAMDLDGAMRWRVAVSARPYSEYTASQLIHTLDSLTHSWHVIRADEALYELLDYLSLAAASLIGTVRPAEDLDVRPFRVVRSILVARSSDAVGVGQQGPDAAVSAAVPGPGAGVGVGVGMATDRGQSEREKQKPVPINIASQRFVREVSARMGALYETVWALQVFGRSVRLDEKHRRQISTLVDDPGRVRRIYAARGAVPEFLDFLAQYTSRGAGQDTTREQYGPLRTELGLCPGDADVYTARRPFERPDSRTVILGVRGRCYNSYVYQQATTACADVLSAASTRLRRGRRRSIAVNTTKERLQSGDVSSTKLSDTDSAVVAATDAEGLDPRSSAGPHGRKGRLRSSGRPTGEEPVTLVEISAPLGSLPHARSSMSIGEEAATLATIDTALRGRCGVEFSRAYVFRRSDIAQAVHDGAFIEYRSSCVPAIVVAGNSYDVVYAGTRIETSCLAESVLVWSELMSETGLIPPSPRLEDVIGVSLGTLTPKNVSVFTRILRACVDASLGTVVPGTWRNLASAWRSIDSDSALAKLVPVRRSSATLFAVDPTSAM